MVIYGIYIVSKSGGLIFNYDHTVPKIETTRRFTYPIDLKLNYESKKISVQFGQRDGIHVGHVLTAINGIQITGRQLDDGKDAVEILESKENYPLTLTFERPKMTTNEKIFLASMFYPLFAIASQLSPEPKSSGIELLEADTFKLHCFQTLTGVKIMVVVDKNQIGAEVFLKRVYELYADYALKNPFYSLEMPIRCELFDQNLKTMLEQIDKGGIASI
ncbi:trafficking protein particle complex subunit 4 [Anthonomus grandis grandis]|uniref:trafficking protein particle complex subunit 4 n=1 Tax=Anthonomus grandis grandis TaxID=2921223 RepID=UPI002165F933|nr:trafficking protein particle complex subunit 4 [Anthonomus grandis grandis]XP_050307034.1 trafficking protein particle complex subunit 4 [Anthonomus grandis grandis]XP_050307035.1 trafficking protein particle complex subunit 4 [Anthonomus grandis grandis]